MSVKKPNELIDRYEEMLRGTVSCYFDTDEIDEISDFVRIMEDYNVKKCIYGHLHGPAHKFVVEKNLDGIEYIMTSCDYTNFKLLKIY